MPLFHLCYVLTTGFRATVDGKDVILIYGDSGESHETAILFSGDAPKAKVVFGDGKIETQMIADKKAVAIQYKTTGQTVVEVGSTTLYILGMFDALTTSSGR